MGFGCCDDNAVVIADVTILKNNERKITYYSVITGASGTITPPVQSTINTNEFGESGNAILSEIDINNKPTYVSPKTVNGVVVTASLNDVTGAWIASGVYTSVNVALIYSLKIKEFYYSNLNYFYILDEIDLSESLTTKDAIVAFAGGGQADAVILGSNYNIVDTVASSGDSVKCDAAIVAKVKTVFNSDVNDMNLYPAIGERFKNGTTLMAINDPISIAGSNGIQLICYTNGIWRFN